MTFSYNSILPQQTAHVRASLQLHIQSGRQAMTQLIQPNRPLPGKCQTKTSVRPGALTFNAAHVQHAFN